MTPPELTVADMIAWAEALARDTMTAQGSPRCTASMRQTYDRDIAMLRAIAARLRQTEEGR